MATATPRSNPDYEGLPEDYIPIAEPTTPDRDNGWHHARCPTCGNTFTWSTAIRPEQQVRCDHEVTDEGKKKRCSQKMLSMEWEYLREMERRKLAS